MTAWPEVGGDAVFSADDVRLVQGDCRDLLPRLPDGWADITITDPPYSDRTHRNATSWSGHDLDTSRQVAGSFSSIEFEDLRSILGLVGRATRRWTIATMDYRHAFRLEDEPPDGMRMLRIGIWVKPDSIPQMSGDRPGMGWEAVAFLHRAGERPQWNGGGRNSVWTVHRERTIHHPTVKPQRLLQDWVRLFAGEGPILDPFTGSASTLIAARMLGRRSLGMEIDPACCEKAIARLGQGVLDFGPQ